MKTIMYWNEDETTLFAVEELRRLLKKAGHNFEVSDFASGGAHGMHIHLVLVADYNKIPTYKAPLKVKGDGFLIIPSNEEDEDQWIMANEPRGLLYGVYNLLQRYYGYRFLNLDEETIATDRIETGEDIYYHEPRFMRRGNVIETINDPFYLRSLIDWGVKNGHNEYFFTFFLWDELKDYLTPELKKRGVHVTLGGHSLSYLLTQIANEESPEELAQDEKLTFFAENITLQDKLIDLIVRKCMEETVISRISLWPEDSGIDEKSGPGFIATYIRFTDKLKKALADASLSVDVEHIVYNAGLSWDMLEREKDTQASSQSDVLYAYWGRDYSESIKSETEHQQRAYHSLLDWNEQAQANGRSLTVFEYYSDHYMLSELFPPLINRIKEDVEIYQQKGVAGVLNLIVPLHKKGQFNEIDDTYPWKWIHHLNNYVYARMVFGDDFQTIMSDYFNQFNRQQAALIKMMPDLEQLVSKHTKWNMPLFPARVVDPEKVAVEKLDAHIADYLAEVNELVRTFDLEYIHHVLPLQTADNYTAFSPHEMIRIYVYYLKLVSEKYGASWRERLDESK